MKKLIYCWRLILGGLFFVYFQHQVVCEDKMAETPKFGVSEERKNIVISEASGSKVLFQKPKDSRAIDTVTKTVRNEVIVAFIEKWGVNPGYFFKINAKTGETLWEINTPGLNIMEDIAWVDDSTVLGTYQARKGSSYVVVDISKKKIITQGRCGFFDWVEIKDGKVYRVSQEVDAMGEGKTDENDKPIIKELKVIYDPEKK